MRRIYLCSYVPFLFAGLAFGQQPQVPKQMTEEVSIIVTGKDNVPVEDLKESDLTVKDNNKAQQIISFDKVAAGVPAAQGKPGLHNLVLIDALNSTYSDVPENHLAMLKIVHELSKPGDITALFLHPKLQIVSDPAAQEGGPELLRKFARQGFDPANPKTEAFGWVFTDPLALFQIFTPAGVIDNVRMKSTLASLQVIASNYQGRSGRKNLYWITRNVPIPMGETGAGYNESKLNSGQNSKTVGDDLSIFAKDADNTKRMLTNSGISLYPIDSRALAIDNMKVSDQASMTDAASATGGLAYTSPRDLSVAVRDAINDARVSYVLRYAISDLKNDGKMHRIKIDTTRKDVKLRYREGYYGPSGGK